MVALQFCAAFYESHAASQADLVNTNNGHKARSTSTHIGRYCDGVAGTCMDEMLVVRTNNGVVYSEIQMRWIAQWSSYSDARK